MPIHQLHSVIEGIMQVKKIEIQNMSFSMFITASIAAMFCMGRRSKISFKVRSAPPYGSQHATSSCNTYLQSKTVTVSTFWQHCAWFRQSYQTTFAFENQSLLLISSCIEAADSTLDVQNLCGYHQQLNIKHQKNYFTKSSMSNETLDNNLLCSIDVSSPCS